MTANPNKPYEMRNISRIDKRDKKWNSEAHAWQVRFKRDRKPISAWFQDNKFGSSEGSLKAAKAYRDAMEKELGGRLLGGPIPELKVDSENLVGVARRVRKVTYNSGTVDFPVWTASWKEGAQNKRSKSFAVSKYGEEEALRLAIEARNKGTKNYFERTQSENAHIAFRTPKNAQIRVWRYMDFTKFVSMLQHKGLFFSRIDELDDSFEGSFSKANKLLRPLIAKHKKIDPVVCGRMVKELRRWVIVNCWHINDQESAAMWNLYSKSNEAICIQSTYEKLRTSLPSLYKLGTVQYIDYEREWIEQNDPLLPFLYKRKSFEHEQEVRVIHNLSGVRSFDDPLPTEEPPAHGIWQKLNLQEFVEKVYIAPQADDWFYRLVVEESRMYGFSFPVKKSSLEEEPFF